MRRAWLHSRNTSSISDLVILSYPSAALPLGHLFVVGYYS